MKLFKFSKVRFNLLWLLAFLLPIIFSTCKDFPSDNTNNSVDPKNLTETIYDEFPSWLQDGKAISYKGGTIEDGFGLYGIDSSGSNKREIAVPMTIFEYDWSPDGKWIVYSEGRQIYKRNIEDSRIIKLTSSGGNFFPSWSLDGQWIAYDSDVDSPNGMNFIWKMSADGTEKKRIIYTPDIGEVRQPDWFPDGVRLAVSRYVGHGAPEIAIIDTMGQSLKVITNDNKFDLSPKVSNDGKNIIFWRYDNYGEILRASINNDYRIEIVKSGYCKHPNWSPDSELITYSNSSYNDGRIWVMNKDGSNARKISF